MNWKLAAYWCFTVAWAVGGALLLRHLNKTWPGPVGPILPAAAWLVVSGLLIIGGVVWSVLAWWR